MDALTQIMHTLDPSGALHRAVTTPREVTPEERAALVAELERRADWHDDDVFAGRYWVPIETAADVAIDAGWKP